MALLFSLMGNGEQVVAPHLCIFKVLRLHLTKPKSRPFRAPQTLATVCPWDNATLRVGDELVGAIDICPKEKVTREGKPRGRVCCKETLGMWILYFMDKELCTFCSCTKPTSGVCMSS